jgi:aspartokinase/homoserine dehydrogenase 1
MKILKFGGTSVQNAEMINQVYKIVSDKLKEDTVGVVVSACSGITNKLIESGKLASKGDEGYKTIFYEIVQRHFDIVYGLFPQAAQPEVLEKVKGLLKDLEDLLRGIFLIKEISPRSMDLIQSFGERLSGNIIADCFSHRGIPAEFADARQLVKTDKNFTSAGVNYEVTNKNIQNYFQTHTKLQIIPGFIGSTHDNETTTLGRGGSDFSGAIFAGALDVSALEIWTDVDGMFTTDPRVVKKAFIIKTISYDEALELSHFGSKVIHPRTIAPALAKKIPIWIKNTFNPSFEGTLICEKTGDTTSQIRGISSLDNVCLVSIQGPGLAGVVGMAARVFQTIANESINILLITQGSSEHSITFSVMPDDAKKAKELIEREFALELKLKLIEPLIIEENLCIVAVVGENMKDKAGISARLFEAVGRNGISVVATAQGASQLNISIVMDNKHRRKALNSIHEAFFLSDTQTINAYVVGTGNIGSTLLKQINYQKEYLATNNQLEIKVVGIANVDKSYFDLEGIDLTNWKEVIESRGTDVNMTDFVNKIKEFNLRNSVLVDNSGSPEVPKFYEELLSSNVSIVTPSKIANSSPYENYEKIHKAASRYGVSFLYETNVGAGLPVINTLKDLIRSGDKILKIEAILSGSLNYIFSSISDSKSYFEAVKEAQQKGYTEPDPRTDLCGLDVARKILILSRETGKKNNIEDINIENCLSHESESATSMDEFWEKLETIDSPRFDQWRKKAESNSKCLKYIACFENGNIYTGVREFDHQHAFSNVKGSDNIVVFTTERYKSNPLIVIGPGAGAEVTAAGVFADIMRIVG